MTQPVKVIFRAGDISFEGILNHSKTAQAILRRLPLESTVNRWGDEIYFGVPLSLPPENPTLSLDIGDIAYWPEGACLCVFFGRTPASINNQPRPASEVNVVGETQTDPSLLRRIPQGTFMYVDRL